MNSYAIFGNPVMHSKSPCVHRLLMRQIKIASSYKRILVTKGDFISMLDNFFLHGGKGANITTPFKEEAFQRADKLTKRAKISGAVNTFKYLGNKRLLGDNTDGIGLIEDLKRISFIQTGFRILLIGAGGASRGVILPLLSLNCTISITNRTFSKAIKLAENFNYAGTINAIPMDKLIDHKFDLIINATSSGMNNEIPNIPSKIITPYTFCYDMSYKDGHTPFLNWCKYHGAKNRANGLGMLVEQAAHTILLWHDILPNSKLIIQKLQKKHKIHT